MKKALKKKKINLMMKLKQEKVVKIKLFKKIQKICKFPKMKVRYNNKFKLFRIKQKNNLKK